MVGFTTVWIFLFPPHVIRVERFSWCPFRPVDLWFDPIVIKIAGELALREAVMQPGFYTFQRVGLLLGARRGVRNVSDIKIAEIFGEQFL